MLVHFVKDVATTFFSHLRLDAYGNEIFQCRAAGLIDRSGMLAVITFRTEREVVGWRKMPTPLAGAVFLDKVAEVLAMVVLIVGQVIENHSAVHFFHGLRILREIAGQCQKVAIIQHWFGE